MTNIPNGEARGLNDTDAATGGVSRRTWLAGAALAGAGLACGLATTRAQAQSKMKQADAKYQDKPQGADKCSGCALFVAPSACSAVDGTISPEGWCSLYAAKS